MFFRGEKPNEEKLPQVKEVLTFLENVLKKKQYVAADRLTIAGELSLMEQQQKEDSFTFIHASYVFLKHSLAQDIRRTWQESNGDNIPKIRT